jgi:hypothetical protein
MMGRLDGGIRSSAQSLLQTFSLSGMDCSDEVQWRQQDLINLAQNVITNMFFNAADTKDEVSHTSENQICCWFHLKQ